MPKVLQEADARSKLVKEKIISKLIDDGYGTYARRLKEFDFIVADGYHGEYIGTAAMFPNTGDIVINPSFLDPQSIKGDEAKALDQLSVLIRHELLHFLLVHEKRLVDHLKQTDSAWEDTYNKMSIHEIANYAMDYDISNEGYDSHDKEVVRTMTLNGRVIGGLIAEDDHPEWGKKTMEEMFDILRQEHEANLQANGGQNTPPTTLNLHKITHSQEYTDMYNKVIQVYDNGNYTDGDLAQLIADLTDGKDINI